MIVARTQDQVEHELRQLLPPSENGLIWNADGYRGALDKTLANGIATFEEVASSMQVEIDPRTAVSTLDAFQRVLGPDGWGVDELGMTDQQQANIAYLRWTAGGNVCAGLFVAIAAALGVAISIQEQVTTRCGSPQAICGQSNCMPTPNQFVWVVTVPRGLINTPVSGAAVCGAAWCGGNFTPNLVEGVLRAMAPAHTIPVFSYTG